MNNAELIKALRCDGTTCRDECPYGNGREWCDEDRIINDAADALEAAEAQIAKLEAKEPTEKQVVDYCHKRCLVIIEEELFHKMKSKYSQMPKEGEWIWENYYWHCSVCGKNPTYGMGYVQGKNELFKVCPNCGARMKTVTNCHALEEER